MNRRRILLSVMLLASLPLFCGGLFSKSKGKIKSDTPGVTMNLEGPWWSKAKLGPEAKAIEVKTGNYKARKLTRTLTRQAKKEGAEDTTKETWRITSIGPWGKLSKIKVQKNKTTTLKFSGPVIFAPDVKISKPSSKARDQRRIVSIGLKLIGEYGEEYNARVVKLNASGKSTGVAAPMLKIFDKSGKELANGKFAFG